MLAEIQALRARLHHAYRENLCIPGAPDPGTLVGVELNTSCPNIKNSAPLAYDFTRLTPLLDVLAEVFAEDNKLTIGLKFPPYLYEAQFRDVVQAIAAYSVLYTDGSSDQGSTAGVSINPFAYFACTNTVGNSLLFADQTGAPTPIRAEGQPYGLPSPLGGLGGEAIHALALGNVYTFAELLIEL